MATKHVTICMPGILARSGELHRPLWFERFGEVEYLDYKQDGFDDQQVIAMAVQTVEQYKRDGYTVTLIGSSMGANFGAFVCQRLKARHDDLNEWFRFVVIDGPAGIRTFAATKSWPPGLITSWFGSAVFAALGWAIMFVGRMGPGLPKDEFITKPSKETRIYLAGRSEFTVKQWRTWVKNTFKQGLTGHSSRTWAKQLQWMTRVAEDGSLDAAVRSLRGLNVVYVQCTNGNDVVVQPTAMNWWLERMGYTNLDGSARWRTVEAPHCGYLQMQPEFDKVVAPLIRR